MRPVAPPRTALAVRRVRIRAPATDRLRAQLHFGRLLRAASVRPDALPPQAILLVRSLRDPLPGTVSPRDAVLPPQAWERAVARRLDDVARTAARPAHEPAGEGVEAVLFLDRAELLACLASDRLRGVAAGRWWWRLLGARGSPPRVADAFGESPEHVPAALDLLAARGEAAAAVRELTAEEAIAVLAAVRKAFALTGPPGEAEPAAAPVAATAPAESPRPPRPARDVGPPSPPWAGLVPEARAPSLTREQEELLGISLVLRRAAQSARTPSFARALARWRAAATAEAGTEPGTARPASVDATSEPPRGRAPSHPDRPESPLPRPPSAPPRTSTVATPGAAEPETETAARPARPVVPVPEPTAEPRADAEAVPVPAEPPETPVRLTPVATALGGAFYLVDLALALGLYGDFTTPAQPGIDLDPWDFVTLLTAELLAEPRPDDALWTLLAELSGRTPDDPPGRGFRPPASWRVPVDWVRPLDDGRPLTWRAAHGRLVLEHPARFRVVDVARRGSLRRQLERELRPWGGRPVAGRGAGLALPRDPLARWVVWVALYLRARLAAALSASDPDSLSRRLLEHRAEVYVTPAHVDVVLRLDELPLEIRVAGLDRTPGWIPAAGRHLAFHFE